ncbi:hypothetical protein EUTSA_v10014201mg [Eutrema salsugineum]|uniref:Uncharacterized protein n=1 Tax=Eutrema salsugineum TaxID=72664 RepID=V4LEK4_EUTSA|nr:uncharacterized protein LOC18017233 [Eutrema salsugineum]ESQ40842.1 hypothetical protein EUTSA_v10014201mg [Eutrema salsugineum]
MLPLKLARSLLLHETLNLTHNCGDQDEVDGDGDGETSIRQILSSYKQSKTRSRSENKNNNSNTRNSKTPLLVFVPTRELIADAYRLATIARDLGMDLYPTPSLSHIIFSFPPRESGSPSPFSSSSHPSTWSSSAASLSSSLSWSLPNDAVMLSFPSLSASSLSHLRSFVSLSNGLFKLVFSAAVETPSSSSGSVSNWDCCSVSLFSRITSKRIGSMESFSQALASNGWTIYKTKENPSPESTGHSNSGSSAYLFRKVYTGRVMTRDRNGGSCRVRELRLPQLDFRNAPLRILQYLMLMTDDLFFLA